MIDPQADHNHEAPAESGTAVVRGSKLALTAMILGIPGLCIAPLGIAALILGIVALVQIADPQRHLAGKGMALAGTILGGLSIVMLPILALLAGILLPALGAARTAAMDAKDMSNIRQIGIGMIAYAYDHNDVLPEHPRDITSYSGGSAQVIFISPHHDPATALDRGDSDGTAIRYGSYVFLFSGTPLEDIEFPSQTILAYTAKASENQRRRAALFVDGHAELIEEQHLPDFLPMDIDIDALDGP
jgi:Domain of unknown function (DUF4190)